MAPRSSGLAVLVSNRPVEPSCHFLAFPPLIRTVPWHLGPLQNVQWLFPFLLCVSTATAGSQLQRCCGEGHRMLMGHLAVSVPVWVFVENKIELTEGESAILT